MNTSEHDMDIDRRACPYVFCKTVENGGSRHRTAPATAKGVFHGIEASVQLALGRDLDGVRVLVQGMGAVGALLAAAPARGGRRPARLRRRRRPGSRLGTAGRARRRRSAPSATCSRRAPSAASINAATVDELRCRVVAGAANNQLAAPSLADRLHERGILYAPDYVINAGGVLHGAGPRVARLDEQQVDERLRGIGTLLLELYADGDGSPVHAADRLVERRLRA